MASLAQPLPQISADTAASAHLSPPVSNSNPALRPVQTPVTAAPGMGNIPTDPDDEEGLKHLEQVKFLSIPLLLTVMRLEECGMQKNI